MDKRTATLLIKNKAVELGFMYCGISKAEPLKKEAERLEKWLSQKKNGTMQWMENNFDKRVDPTRLVPGAKSVISLAYNYYPAEQVLAPGIKISKYAYGQDYHKVIKDKMFEFFAWLNETIGDIDGRVFVDSAPVMDKVWAAKSGIGWQGKHTNLIAPKGGSFFFLSEIISDLELEADGPIKDYCGTCTRCIDACPTEALKPYEIDANKCISYLTIELKEDIPNSFKNKWKDWAFGCDICQDVCPWNKWSKPHSEPLFFPNQGALYNMNNEKWRDLTEDLYQLLFKKSAVKRAKLSGLQRNITFLMDGDHEL